MTPWGIVFEDKQVEGTPWEERGPVAWGTNIRHQRNGQDVEYVSFFVSLISITRS